MQPRTGLILCGMVWVVFGAPSLAESAPEAPVALDAASLQQVLDDQIGKVVLLNFWATWCRPCLKEIPALQELASRYDATEFVLIPVSLDEMDSSQAVVTAFLARWFPDFDTWLSAEPEMDTLVSVVDPAWNEVLPTSYIIARDGTVARRLQGGRAINEFDAAVKAALKP